MKLFGLGAIVFFNFYSFLALASETLYIESTPAQCIKQIIQEKLAEYVDLKKNELDQLEYDLGPGESLTRDQQKEREFLDDIIQNLHTLWPSSIKKVTSIKSDVAVGGLEGLYYFQLEKEFYGTGEKRLFTGAVRAFVDSYWTVDTTTVLGVEIAIGLPQRDYRCHFYGPDWASTIGVPNERFYSFWLLSPALFHHGDLVQETTGWALYSIYQKN